MKSLTTFRWILVVVVFVVIIWMMPGNDKHYVDVYINTQCKIVTLDNDAEIPELFFFPDDYVIWNNMSGDEVKLNFPDGWFEEDEVTIPENQRVILQVIRDEPGASSLTVDCDGGAGSPAIKIGEDP